MADMIGGTYEHPRLDMRFRRWDDGIQQWFRSGEGKDFGHKFIERDWNLRNAKSGKRKHWCIVKRHSDDSNEKYAPIVAGPFPNIKVALTAYLVMVGGA